ncbi:MAG TPA: hypothetical protein VGK96_06690 [Candidatus Sulfotelmatobacter sp.]
MKRLANPRDNLLQVIGVEESLHFAPGAVNLGVASGNFQLKSCGDRRMVLTSAGDAQVRGCSAKPAAFPPLFLWHREGLQEHAVGLSLPTAGPVAG